MPTARELRLMRIAQNNAIREQQAIAREQHLADVQARQDARNAPESRLFAEKRRLELLRRRAAQAQATAPPAPPAEEPLIFRQPGVPMEEHPLLREKPAPDQPLIFREPAAVPDDVAAQEAKVKELQRQAMLARQLRERERLAARSPEVFGAITEDEKLKQELRNKGMLQRLANEGGLAITKTTTEAEKAIQGLKNVGAAEQQRLANEGRIEAVRTEQEALTERANTRAELQRNIARMELSAKTLEEKIRLTIAQGRDATQLKIALAQLQNEIDKIYASAQTEADLAELNARITKELKELEHNYGLNVLDRQIASQQNLAELDATTKTNIARMENETQTRLAEINQQIAELQAQSKEIIAAGGNATSVQKALIEAETQKDLLEKQLAAQKAQYNTASSQTLTSEDRVAINNGYAPEQLEAIDNQIAQYNQILAAKIQSGASEPELAPIYAKLSALSDRRAAITPYAKTQTQGTEPEPMPVETELAFADQIVNSFENNIPSLKPGLKEIALGTPLTIPMMLNNRRVAWREAITRALKQIANLHSEEARRAASMGILNTPDFRKGAMFALSGATRGQLLDLLDRLSWGDPSVTPQVIQETLSSIRR